MEGRLTFADLNEGHISRIVEIEARTHGTPWGTMSFKNELGHKDGIFIVSEIEGVIVAYGGAWMVMDEAHVTNVVVDAPHRGKGYGRQVMNELLLRCKTRGATCSTLEVRAGNAAAIGLYKSLGYQDVGRRKAYYADNKEDAAVMWLYDLDAWQPR